MRCGCSAFVDFVALVPVLFEVDVVGHEGCRETTVVVCPLIVPGSV